MRRNGFWPVTRVQGFGQGEQVLIRNKNEIGFTLCRMDRGGLTNGPISEGTPMNVSIALRCPPRSRPVGTFHTHPGGVALPSAMDVNAAKTSGIKNLCIQSNTELACFRVR